MPTDSTVSIGMKTEQRQRPLEAGPTMINMGASGTGKTTAIKTLLEAGLEVFVLFTEPRWAPLAQFGASDGFHYNFVKPSTTSFKHLIARAKRIQHTSWNSLKEQISDPEKGVHAQAYVNMLEQIDNFVCTETGREYGNVGEWDNTRAFVFDSLSGLNTMAMKFITGMAMARSQPQWGAAQEAELQIISQLCYDTQCTFILTAHVDKVYDETEGTHIKMIKALGQKLAPQVPTLFDDVVLSYKESGRYLWTNMRDGYDLKPTWLPAGDKLFPSYVPAIENWRKTIGK